jgi:hypothetical protein
VFLSKGLSDYHSLSFTILHLIVEFLKASLKTAYVKHGLGLLFCVGCRMFGYFLRGMCVNVTFRIFGAIKNQSNIIFTKCVSLYGGMGETI